MEKERSSVELRIVTGWPAPDGVPVAGLARQWHGGGEAGASRVCTRTCLGMWLVSVPGMKVRFSLWDIRVRTFARFVQAAGRDATKSVPSPASPAPRGSVSEHGTTDWTSSSFPREGLHVASPIPVTALVSEVTRHPLHAPGPRPDQGRRHAIPPTVPKRGHFEPVTVLSLYTPSLPLLSRGNDRE